VFVAGLTIWAMALLLALDNLGVQIKPLLTGLGIGGVAVALAVQSVLGDVLASMSIALDKPFGIGDSLAVDDIQGTVEHIGVKSTRLRSISGEQIILANADVLKARVRNYGRMRERRSAFRLNVTYDTPPEKLRAIGPAVREVVESQPQTRFDRCNFLSFGDWSLQFETVYYVTVSDYKTYAQLQQSINIAILERFDALGVDIAFATHSLHTLKPPK
jgi:small-conductance mechanosensitive channel